MRINITMRTIPLCFLMGFTAPEIYHKSKLTPGVEIMPSWFFLKPLEKFAIDLGGTVGTLVIDDERKVFSLKTVISE